MTGLPVICCGQGIFPAAPQGSAEEKVAMNWETLVVSQCVDITPDVPRSDISMSLEDTMDVLAFGQNAMVKSQKFCLNARVSMASPSNMLMSLLCTWEVT